MPKLTDEEREQRRKKLQDEALESVATRGQFNFRLDGNDIKRLYELAGKKHKPVSAMVREWVLECLEREETNKVSAPLWAQELGQRLAHTEVLIALVTLASSNTQADEGIKNRLREHVLRHCPDEAADELHGLLFAQGSIAQNTSP